MTLNTIEDVRAAVESISDSAEDPESAHSAEDELRGAVLRAIADGSCADPKAWAAAALVTSEFRFPRWCA